MDMPKITRASYGSMGKLLPLSFQDHNGFCE